MPRKTHDTSDYLALANEIMAPVSMSARYERDAEQFFKETGKMAPGKDVPAALGNTPGIKGTDEEFSAWRRENNRKRIAEQAELIRMQRIKGDLRLMVLLAIGAEEVPENHYLDIVECVIDTDTKKIEFTYEFFEVSVPQEDEDDAEG